MHTCPMRTATPVISCQGSVYLHHPVIQLLQLKMSGSVKHHISSPMVDYQPVIIGNRLAGMKGEAKEGAGQRMKERPGQKQ